MAYVIIFSPEFQRDYKELNTATQQLVKTKGALLAQEPSHPFLKTHKLSGTLVGRFSCSVDYKIRIIFRFIEKNTIELLRVGDHGIYKKR